jgi:hypothetical protein
MPPSMAGEPPPPARYPTPQHARAAAAIVDFFAARPETESVLLTWSCARGKASPESCLDFSIVLRPDRLAAQRAEVEAAWERYYESTQVFAEMRALADFSHVDLELTDGCVDPADYYHGPTTGADAFELEIGNTFEYAVPLWERSDYYREMQAEWLPYYGDELRAERLAMARGYCLNNLDHIPSYVTRGLYFQSFGRLYDAFGEFLQALFIARRVYPVAYDKWIREQIVDILGLPDLYPHLPHLLEITHFESDEIAGKGRDLRALLQEYVG